MYFATSRLAIFCAAILSSCILLDATRADSIVHFSYDGALQGGYDVQVYSGPTPVTAKNFLRYVNHGLYDNTIIHNDDRDIVLEGGGFVLDNPDNYEAYPAQTPLSEVLPFNPIVNEPGLSNLYGTLAMEKEAGAPDSATSRWYINLRDNSSTRDTQNGGYTVFGMILDKGMTFVEQIDFGDTKISSYLITPPYSFPELTNVPLYDTSVGSDYRLSFIVIANAAIVPAVWNSGNSPTDDWEEKANWDGAYKDVCVPDGVGARIVLDNQTPVLKTLDMATTGRTVGMISFVGSGTEITSSGQHALTLDNIDQPAMLDVAGTHVISAPVVLAGDANITGSGTLTMSGGVSGAFALKVVGGTLNASSIQVDSLTIGEAVVIVPTIEWKGGDSADPTDWAVVGNWITTGNAPSGAGSKVAFGNQSSENNTVDLKTADQTVGYMSFAEGTSTTILSSGQHSLALDNLGQTAEISVAGTHAINVPVVLAGDANITGTGNLSLSGGISGAFALTVTSDVLTASSIQVDTLNIGAPVNPTVAVPEPTTLALCGMGFAVLFAFGWRRKVR